MSLLTVNNNQTCHEIVDFKKMILVDKEERLPGLWWTLNILWDTCKPVLSRVIHEVHIDWWGWAENRVSRLQRHPGYEIHSTIFLTLSNLEGLKELKGGLQKITYCATIVEYKGKQQAYRDTNSIKCTQVHTCTQFLPPASPSHTCILEWSPPKYQCIDRLPIYKMYNLYSFSRFSTVFHTGLDVSYQSCLRVL